MRFSIYILLFNISLACQSQTSEISNSHNFQPEISQAPLPRFYPDSHISYAQSKSKALKIKSQLKIDMPLDSLSNAITQILLQRIFPYWYGTPWSFEGHISKPGQGSIACGYFVSTTLKAAGVNINRYLLAQQLPIHEAKTLALEDSVYIISEGIPEENAQKIMAILNDGIHFIGFDRYHVGFVLKQQGQLILIHSNYYAPQGVVMEYALQSEVFRRCSKLYISKISGNKSFMYKWLNNEAINIVKE